LGRTSSPKRSLGDLPSWAVVTASRRKHVARVVRLLAEWAEAMDVSARERQRWLRAAWMHDALKDAPRAVVRKLAAPFAGPPAILHGPAAARRAALARERDRGVLDAIRYHSVGYADWDHVGRMLYLADFLEAGRRHHDAARTAQAKRVPGDPDGVLWAVARDRIAHGIRKGLPLLPETVAFWNALT